MATYAATMGQNTSCACAISRPRSSPVSKSVISAAQAEGLRLCARLDGEGAAANVSAARIVFWSLAAAASLLVVIWFGVERRLGAVEPDIGKEIAALCCLIERGQIGALMQNAALDEHGEKTGLGAKITLHGKPSAKGSRRCNKG
ncbi:MAG: hypothetical protein ACREDJ_01360, partial [Methylocella sp.]